MTKKWTRALWIFAMIFALMVTCIPAVTVEAAGTMPEEVESATVVWDFENMPDSLDGWYSDLYVECGWNPVGGTGMSAGNWTLSVVDGKGADGSRGLSCYLPEHVWGNTTYLEMSRDSSAITDWTGAENLYFYVDASETTEDDPRLDIMIRDYETILNSGYSQVIDSTYYYWANDAWTPAQVNEWGHLVVPAGYVGWLKIPIADVMGVASVSEVTRICFYTEHNTPNAAIYLDHFAIDAEVAAPVDPVDPSEISTGTVVWDMENLTGDLTGWTTDKFFELWADETVGVMGGNWTPVASAGKGYNGSAALGWKLLTSAWGSTTYVNLSNDNTAITNWSGATEMYFYIDATEVGADMPIDILLPVGENEITEVPGTTWYLWKNNTWVERKVNEHGHFVIPAHFAGWVRVPLGEVYGNFAELENVSRIGFYTEHTQIDATVYFDHFVVNADVGQNQPSDPGVTEPSGDVTEPSTGTTEPQPTEPQGGKPDGSSMDWIWIVVAVVVCGGAIAAALVIKKKRSAA